MKRRDVAKRDMKGRDMMKRDHGPNAPLTPDRVTQVHVTLRHVTDYRSRFTISYFPSAIWRVTSRPLRPAWRACSGLSLPSGVAATIS